MKLWADPGGLPRFFRVTDTLGSLHRKQGRPLPSTLFLATSLNLPSHSGQVAFEAHTLNAAPPCSAPSPAAQAASNSQVGGKVAVALPILPLHGPATRPSSLSSKQQVSLSLSPHLQTQPGLSRNFQTSLSLNLDIPCLCLPSAGIKCVHHHLLAPLPFL